MVKRFLHAPLALLASAVLRQQHPAVVGITGSVGKTSTKDAIALVLGAQRAVRASSKNYNNEIGVPLTILGQTSPSRSVLGWIRTFWRGLQLVLRRPSNYPDTLVLEMGADHPGDIAYLTHLARPTVGVLTGVSHAHTEFFGSVERVLKEKSGIVTHLGNSGTAILNADDDRVMSLAGKLQSKIVTFGFHDHADVHAVQERVIVGFWDDPASYGMQCDVEHAFQTVPLVLKGVIGKHQLMAPLAAIAVGITFGMSLQECVGALAAYHPPAGRMRLLKGKNETMIIDDTYNSSPSAAEAALRALAEFPASGRRIAILGDMAELGHYAQQDHETIGKRVQELGITELCTVGKQAGMIAAAAKHAGMNSDNVWTFPKADEAGVMVSQNLHPHDVILVKGSQSVRLEKVVKALLAEPEQAGELLVRQDASWARS